MNLPENTSAEDFARWVLENKPYLVEIEEEIQNIMRMATEAKIKVEIHIRGGHVVKIDFWKQRSWNYDKGNLTQFGPDVIK